MQSLLSSFSSKDSKIFLSKFLTFTFAIHSRTSIASSRRPCRKSHLRSFQSMNQMTVILNSEVTVMLVTSLCWWLYDGDWFQMLVSESLYWRLFSLCWWFSQCIKSVTNILNRSSTSQSCHQHIQSPTSVTNSDVTEQWSVVRSRKVHLFWKHSGLGDSGIIK